jgi:hypothetical protein
MEAFMTSTFNNLGRDNHSVSSERQRVESARIERAMDISQMIIQQEDGYTFDSDIYSAAIFGKTIEEGLAENDKHVVRLTRFLEAISKDSVMGQKITLEANEYRMQGKGPDSYSVASFSREEFVPVQYEITQEDRQAFFPNWLGNIAIAVTEQDTHEPKVVSFMKTFTWVNMSKNPELRVSPRSNEYIQATLGNEVFGRFILKKRQ